MGVFMNTYKVAIEETVVQNFDVIATSEKEVIKVAIRKYKNGEFVL